MDGKKVAIIGAGPAGLTAAYLLTQQGVKVTVLEGDPKYVGGISRTVTYKGFRLDVGGHRFFSKSKEVNDLWDEILEDGFLERPRSSKIYYRNTFFSYPLKAAEALFGLGVFESFRCVASYLKSRLFPIKDPKNFEEWVVNKFGRRLFEIFFKTYTEKVWGMACTEISADWAAQRIKGLSLGKAIYHALIPQRKGGNSGTIVKTLIDRFKYPRLGPGMMWEACAKKVIKQGGKIKMGCQVRGLTHHKDTGKWDLKFHDGKKLTSLKNVDVVISSAPMRELMLGITPKVKPSVVHAASSLKYRDFLMVGLILEETEAFSDNWIYIHDPGVKVGRIQNFKSWSPDMVPDPKYSCYGMEYFCFEGDGLWTSSDEDLIALAKSELEKLDIAKASQVKDGTVVRQKKAYPVYDDEYKTHVEVVKEAIHKDYPGLYLVGRNGMHKYNNQDHAMMTAAITANNILSDFEKFDVWNVNQDAEYHESGDEQSFERLVPKRAA